MTEEHDRQVAEKLWRDTQAQMESENPNAAAAMRNLARRGEAQAEAERDNRRKTNVALWLSVGSFALSVIALLLALATLFGRA